VVKLNAAGSALVYGTFLGGTWYDAASAITLDGTGNAYVTGTTQSYDFPVTPGAFDTTYDANFGTFVARLNSAGSALLYATYLGHDNTEGIGIAADGAGNAYVTGYTNSRKFPTTADAFQTKNNGADDVFLAKFNGTGTDLTYGSYLGGFNAERGGAIAVDSAGNACVIGYTFSADFPITPGAFDTTYNLKGDAFVAKFRALGRAPAEPHQVVP
jgi:hypothetical protein